MLENLSKADNESINLEKREASIAQKNLHLPQEKLQLYIVVDQHVSETKSINENDKSKADISFNGGSIETDFDDKNYSLLNTEQMDSKQAEEQTLDSYFTLFTPGDMKGLTVHSLISPLKDSCVDGSVSIYSIMAFCPNPLCTGIGFRLIGKTAITIIIQLFISSLVIYTTVSGHKISGKEWCPSRDMKEHFVGKLTGFTLSFYLYYLTLKHIYSNLPDTWTLGIFQRGVRLISIDDSDDFNGIPRKGSHILSRKLKFPTLAMCEIVINTLCIWISTTAGLTAIYFVENPFDMILNCLAMTFLFEMDELIVTPAERESLLAICDEILENLDQELFEGDDIEQCVTSSCSVRLYWNFQRIFWLYCLKPLFFLAPFAFAICF